MRRRGIYTAHYWTLAVEEHFYLLWPLIVATQARRLASLAALLALGLTVWRLAAADLVGDTRMDGLLWGCIAAIYFPRLKHWARRLPTNVWLPIAVLTIPSAVAHCARP